MLILFLRHPENQIDTEIVNSVPDNDIIIRLQAAHIPLLSKSCVGTNRLVPYLASNTLHAAAPNVALYQT